jgi:predicted phosphodiesterase
MQRWLQLPTTGKVLISTDLHGNGSDFRRLREIFLDMSDDTHWVNLGDAVHAPDERVRKIEPELYDYDDESLAIVEGILDLQAQYPQRVHYVLGNHDYGHVGGEHTRKFYDNEVVHLETLIGAAGTAKLKTLFEAALLAVVAPCGVFMTHGAPDDTLRDINDLNRMTFPPHTNYLADVMQGLMVYYGQYGDVMARLLETVSKTSGCQVNLHVHGHERDPEGFFTEAGNQVCPVIFGAAPKKKRYLLLNLSQQYRVVEDMRDGIEVRFLYE